MPTADSSGTSPAWNYMQTELSPDDLTIYPLIGPGGLTREQALAEVQSLLERSAAINPIFRPAAQTWRRGAKDDTVFVGPFTWAIYEHVGDPRRGALEWLEDYAAIMRQAGMTDVQVAAPPAQP